jgi:hypothetical protein
MSPGGETEGRSSNPGFMLKPLGLFNRNAALDVPPPRHTAATASRQSRI